MITPPPVWMTDPTRCKRVGVLCGNKFYLTSIIDPRKGLGKTGCTLIDSSSTLDEIVDMALRFECGHIWVLPSHEGFNHPLVSNWDASCHEAVSREGAYAIKYHPLTSRSTVAGLVAQVNNKGLPLCIFHAIMGDAWGIASGIDKLTLTDDKLAYVLTLTSAIASYTLGIQLRYSPSYTGSQLLRMLIPNPETVPELSPEWRARIADVRTTYLQWRRPLFESEKCLPLHKYDRNGSFVSSAREVPIGDPFESDQFIPGAPGVYHVTSFTAPCKLDFRYFTYPGPFRMGEPCTVGEYPIGPMINCDAWIWEPQIRLAIKWGADFTIDKGYVWKNKRDIFRNWQARIWTSRKLCRGMQSHSNPDLAIAAKLAESIVKRLSVATIGRLIAGKGRAVMLQEEAEAEGYNILDYQIDDSMNLTGMVEAQTELGKTDLANPAWWSTIIANSNERVIDTLYTCAPYDTALVYVDEIRTLQEHPELESSWDSVGKFKYEGCLPIGSIPPDWNQQTAATLIKRLKAIGREAN